MSVIGAGFKNYRQHNTLQSYFSGVLYVRGGERPTLIDSGWGGGN